MGIKCGGIILWDICMICDMDVRCVWQIERDRPTDKYRQTESRRRDRLIDTERERQRDRRGWGWGGGVGGWGVTAALKT